VALDGKKIIGCLHAPSVNLKINEDTYFCEPGGDLAVHPDYRGIGVWRSMVDVWTDNKWSPLVVGYSNSSTPVIVNRVKARKSLMLPSPVKHYCRIKNIDEFLKVKETSDYTINKLGYQGLSAITKILNLGKRKTYDGYSISSITRFDDRINDLWDRVKEDYDLVVERKKTYLNWRYCDPRGGSYKVRLVEKGDRILGYYVLRVNRINPEYPEGYIVDVVVAKGDEDAAITLFEDACRYFDSNDVPAVHYWVPKNHFYSEIMGRFGFVDSRREVVVWFGENGDPEILEAIKHINQDRVMFQLGDVDWI
jgi:hypothetical protein